LTAIRLEVLEKDSDELSSRIDRKTGEKKNDNPDQASLLLADREIADPV
jgi:hypothetical protein